MDEELRSIAYDDFELPKDEALPNEDDDVVPETSENERGVKLGDLYLLGAYYECEDCNKVYSYDEGKSLKECACG